MSCGSLLCKQLYNVLVAQKAVCKEVCFNNLVTFHVRGLYYIKVIHLFFYFVCMDVVWFAVCYTLICLSICKSVVMESCYF